MYLNVVYVASLHYKFKMLGQWYNNGNQTARLKRKGGKPRGAYKICSFSKSKSTHQTVTDRDVKMEFTLLGTAGRPNLHSKQEEKDAFF